MVGGPDVNPGKQQGVVVKENLYYGISTFDIKGTDGKVSPEVSPFDIDQSHTGLVTEGMLVSFVVTSQS